MELFLIYLWLKLDTFHVTVFTISSLTITALCIWLFAYSIGYPVYENEKELWRATRRQIFKDVKPYLFTVVFLFGLSLITPSSKDVAILVGASIAIDAAKSPEGQKVGQLLRGKANELLDAEIKKLQVNK